MPALGIIGFLWGMYWTGIIITAILLAAYCILILVYRNWFLRLPVFKAGDDTNDPLFFSIIIPARNEAENIPHCLPDILQQDYPKDFFEVIVINDFSTDGTETLLRSLQMQYPNLRVLNLEDELGDAALNSYKKKAIELAIAKSKGNWIVTTDADCMAGPRWLRTLNDYIRQTNAIFVAAPVMLTNEEGFLSLFQQLDFLSLQGITAASVSAGYHSMCNGANLAYEKDAFYKVNGFAGIDHLASGDDMLLMHKIREQYPGRLGYLFAHDAIIRTKPMPDWKQFLNQRIRWASKADKYSDRSIFYVLFLVYAVNAALLILLLISPWTENGFTNWLLLVIAKTLVELSFMAPVARFFGQANTLLWFPVMQPFHILYTVIAGWLGKFGSYQWKGRKVH